jgi:hypothetical protein
MTDREMLELAAKAAGIWVGDDDFADPIDRKYVDSMGLWVHVGNLEDMGQWWNPLTDDGDALRLAVKLDIDISFYTDREAKTYAQTKHLLGYGTDGYASYQAHEYHMELHANDPLVATRRAIVRAAAEIGKAMP